MRKLLSSIRRFLSELRRRNVYQVAVTYVIVGFFVIEGADLTLTRLGLPPWTVTLVIVLVGLGFPIALVLAWALEMTPEGVRVEEPVPEKTEGSEEVPTPTGTTRDLWVGASVLVLLLLGAWWMWGGFGSRDAPDRTERRAPETKERSIAVLPFEVTGSGAEEWRDGMVTMLSTGLDGAAGLRAIPDRTVLAAWEKSPKTGEGASTEAALAIARQVGAEYAVVGSAVAVGEELRFVAEIRKARGGDVVGKAEARGSPGRVTGVINRLTQKILSVLLEKSEEQLPSVDLASITTSSLRALKSYLAGERHFRAGEYDAAAEDLEAAVEVDSSFALAYWRLSWSYAWTGSDRARWASRRAYELADRLPRRERRIARARYMGLNEGRRFASADTLRQLSRAYPDDPSVWYQLGETVFHSYIPRGWPEAEKAFARAAELDPGMAPYHHHLVDLAFSLHRDSALAAQRIEAHPPGKFEPMYQLVLNLVFGTSVQRREALSRLDTISVPRSSLASNPLEHPKDLTLQDTVLRKLLNREDLDDRSYARDLLINDVERGQISRLLSNLVRVEVRTGFAANLLALSMSQGMPVPDSVARHYLAPENLPADPSLIHLQSVGIYLIEQGRENEVDRIVRRVRAAGPARSQGSSGETPVATVREIKGYRAFKADSLKKAARLWDRSMASPPPGAIWRGDLYRRLGRLKEAEGWYLAAWPVPLAHERLGQLYEEMGKPEKAQAAYERFIAAWKNADPALQDRVEKARGRLKALGPSSAAE